MGLSMNWPMILAYILPALPGPTFCSFCIKCHSLNSSTANFDYSCSVKSPLLKCKSTEISGRVTLRCFLLQQLLRDKFLEGLLLMCAMKGNIQDSSFVVTTGPPQQGKRERISHVRSFIRKSRLQEEKKLARRQLPMNPPERPLRKEMDLSWLPVSDIVRGRLGACKLFIILNYETTKYRTI